MLSRRGSMPRKGERWVTYLWEKRLNFMKYVFVWLFESQGLGWDVMNGVLMPESTTTSLDGSTSSMIVDHTPQAVDNDLAKMFTPNRDRSVHSIQRYRAAIKEKEREIEKCRRDIALLYQKINSVLPVLMIPDERIVEIFLKYILISRMSEGETYKPEDHYVCDDGSIIDRPQKQEDYWRVGERWCLVPSHICHRWRNVALSTPFQVQTRICYRPRLRIRRRSGLVSHCGLIRSILCLVACVFVIALCSDGGTQWVLGVQRCFSEYNSVMNIIFAQMSYSDSAAVRQRPSWIKLGLDLKVRSEQSLYFCQGCYSVFGGCE
ncbi:hypothetical protein QCA50_019757 [Cerrena zonata]|uniref:BHLH domain-containing protein n=1 Tax=Cerrena zonata TaxID=2478898 RepID=A0AAW0FAK9_9APHY